MSELLRGARRRLHTDDAPDELRGCAGVALGPEDVHEFLQAELTPSFGVLLRTVGPSAKLLKVLSVGVHAASR